MAWYNWSQTSAANATADSSINWQEGQAPSSINDSARAMMAATAKYRDDIAGAIVTSGTNTAYNLNSYSNYDTPAHLNGQIIAFTPHATNGAVVTLDIDGLGAKPLRSAPGVELQSGTIIQGTPYMATYNNTDGAFYLHGFFGTPSIPIGAGLDYWLPTTPSSAFAFPIGQAISRTTYATLFAAMGTTFGAGDGSTTFNLPDKRSYVSIAADNMGGTGAGRTGLGFAGTGGVQTQTLNYTNMAPHSHGGTTGADSPDHAHTIGGGATLIVGSSSAPNGDPGTAYVPYPTIAISGTTSGATARHAHPISTDAGPGTSAPFSIMQPTIACNYILRII